MTSAKILDKIYIFFLTSTCLRAIIKSQKGGKQMNESISEIIKDLSEAFLAIVTAICLIVKTRKEKKSKRPKKRRQGKGLKPLPSFTYSIPHSFANINMKLYRIVLAVLTVLILCDGFNGEFASPTTFDWIKWAAWITCSISYIICARRKKQCD